MAIPAGGKATAAKLSKGETKRQRSVDSEASYIQTTKKPTSSTSTVSDSSDVIVSDVSPVRSRFRRVSYSWIEDAELRNQYIDEDERRINELKAQGYHC